MTPTQQLLLLSALLASSSPLLAQNTTTAQLSALSPAAPTSSSKAITGRVLDAKDGEPLAFALLRLTAEGDSSLIASAQTDAEGHFRLLSPRSGKLRLSVNYLGYRSHTQSLQLSPTADSLSLGTLTLHSTDNSLRTAIVSTTAARMQQKADTTIFNAAAFRTAEGSTLEALVSQLPGAEVSSDGTVKVNGKTVKEFLVNGKEFFKGDNSVALKNLPVDFVSKLKTYDKKSDYAEQTGVDDGEESFVMDIVTKRELNQSFVSNIELAGGWDYDNQRRLYSGRLFATRFSDRLRVTFFGKRNNTNDAGFGGPRGAFGGAKTGKNEDGDAGADFNYNNGLRKFTAGYFEVGGNLIFNHKTNQTQTLTATQNFLSQQGTAATRSFLNSNALSSSGEHRLHSRYQLHWGVDSMTNLSLRPTFSWNRYRGRNNSQSATFEDDPFERYAATSTPEVLNAAFAHTTQLDAQTLSSTDPFLLNLNNSSSLTQRNTLSLSGDLDLTRKLATNGRNVSLQLRGNYETTQSFSHARADLYARTASSSSDATLTTRGTHQFSRNEGKTWSYRAGLSYTEPLWGKVYGEVRYHFEHRFNDTDRSLYNLLPLSGYATLADFRAANAQYASISQIYAPEASKLQTVVDAAQQLNTLSAADLYAASRDEANSQYATYNYYTQRIHLGLRYTTKQIRFSAGLSLNPERTRLEYERPSLGKINTNRTTLTASPHLRLRYQVTDNRRLELNYRGESSLPSMTQLLRVVDNANPLNISIGNAGLRPSWNDKLRFEFSDYNINTLSGVMANWEFTNTRNALSTRLIYDTQSGRQFTRPENINGNWNTNGSFLYNGAFGPDRLFHFSTQTEASFAHSVGYVSTSSTASSLSDAPTLEAVEQLFATTASQKNTARNLTLGEKVALGYRSSVWDAELNGRVSHQRATASLQSLEALRTWSFGYGLKANLQLPSGFSLSTDLEMQSRRGFSASALNTNELVWNAQISKSFLRDKSLTISAKFYDILRQQSNVSRTISAMQRSDVWTNSLTAYAMIHVNYKLNIFSSNKTAEEFENRRKLFDPNNHRPGSMPPPNMPAPPGGDGPH